MGFGLTIALGAGIGFVPQFAGPGYELALISGFVLPSVVAISAGLGLSSQAREPFDAYCRGVGQGVLCFVALLVTAMLHGFWVGFCDLLQGTQIMLLGPGLGMALAGAYAALVAELAHRRTSARRRRLAAIALGLFGPLCCIAIGVLRFYSSPMIFGFDPFVGYFSGTIYDTIVELDGLRTYRLGTAATLFAGFVLALHLAHDEKGKLVYQSIGRPGLVVLGVSVMATSLLHTLSGPDLGHWHTASSIARELGGVVDGQRCRVVHSRAIAAEDVQRFARECEALVVEAETYLEVSGPPQITAYLFDDAAQKQRLMGASGTNIAKPWRAEVYVQGTAYPHRVLGHELVHAVAASAGRGPFRVAGRFAGLLPNPGLIEGVAVAAQPRDDELSASEWAKAMKDLGLLPPLSRLFGLDFLGENSSLAYTVSGAFVGYIHSTYGGGVVRDWYGGAELATLTGKSWADLESGFHSSLDQHSLSDAARLRAQAKFDRPGFFKRKCPRTVDACRQLAGKLARNGDALGALLQLERARSLDPGEPSLRIEYAERQIEGGQSEQAKQDLRAIVSDDSLPQHLRARALEVLADQQLVSGELAPAQATYEKLLAATFDAGDTRSLGVKLLATRDEAMRPAVIALLVGEPGRGTDRTRAAELLGALDKERPTDGLASYLLARMRVDARDHKAAAQNLDRALSRTVVVKGVRLEAFRLRIQMACALGDATGAVRTLDAYAREPDVSAARYEIMRRFVARCSNSKLTELPKHEGLGL